ncbi:FAD-binding dehydrogenase [Microbacterium sp. EYE_5]|uniref:FAD-binding dehydrogenase n=1 Tax=unclassified Microbacterium TaxID=2609290 RepID=UPI0020059605|nr:MULTISPECIES: FAD-binding dehydrogenase [unclassified Microbacterium]MCK6079503.1 FAD-binding dehydrogenase [Microbacterium sp. EYE_382]MCK6084773.1 FAD-binding dehydrogenase [Microbacterium sp. EYE_384]MCK6123000.1 FAD-binding dehydrogenase [Microbacterium sp. EYE_80]MCK6125537.1 FAD-binding dehydrogenase [Microbacterium sp. EYE_79]MCK6140457.1 FAD-binding dehydrogenase [Microbacterium sp. EYE_39]
MTTDAADAIVVGAGLAGLVAASELLDAGKRVLIVEQEPEASFGGQAWWSFGGLFLVDSPEQRRLGVKDSLELARQDWLGSAGFDRPEDRWPRAWAEAYLEFAAGEKRAWLRERGIRFFPVVGWAERGGDRATSHGNSVPRFHITWGTGPGVLEPFVRRVLEGAAAGRAHIAFRHRVDRVDVAGGRVVGVSGAVLAPDDAERGAPSNRDETREFTFRAGAVLVSSGGIGGNHDLVRAQWPARMGPAPESMLSGVPAHVDGRMLGVAAEAGARLINGDRMWHYVEGIRNHDPVWPRHGIRILPGPSSLWLDATGHRLPTPLFPGFDTIGTLEHIVRAGHDHSWFVLNQAILQKEFALSGSEQNPDLTGKDVRLLAQRLQRGRATAPVEAFKARGADFVVARTVPELLERMREASPLLDVNRVRLELDARDREMTNPFTKDAQVTAVRQARRYRGDKLLRVATPGPIADPKAGPLIAVRLHVITRKSLGGIETDLSGRALAASGEPVPGLYAAGEASGFGGGGVHGYRALEGTFLGGCIFSGRVAGRAMAAAV